MRLRVLALASLALASGCSSPRSESVGTVSQAALVSPDLVISQVYGGGGNSGATYTHDFVEIFNRGASAVSLGGKTIQYASTVGTFSNSSNLIALPNVTLNPGKYFLVQLGGGANGAALPTPDLVGDADAGTAFGMSNNNGKVALVESSALLNGCGTTAAPCTSGGWIDFVGYGTAQQFEGTAVGALANGTSAIRRGGGCQDTGNNGADFQVATPVAKNSQTAAVDCSLFDGGTDASDASDDAKDAASDATDAASDATDAGNDAPVIDAAPAAVVLLNEVKINPPGSTDSPWEYAEILCTPNASLAGYYFAAIEGDADGSSGAAGRGVADIVVDLSSTVCGSNGLVLIKAAAGGHTAQASGTTVVTSAALDTGSSPFENATTSFVVLKSPSAAITAATDYDTNDDGTLDLPGGATLVDGVSTYEQTADAAADQTYAPRLTQSSGTADGASRLLGNMTPLSLAAWYNADLTGTDPSGLTYDATKGSANLPPNPVMTPGAPNLGAGGGGDGGVDAGKTDSGSTDAGGDAGTGNRDASTSRPDGGADNPPAGDDDDGGGCSQAPSRVGSPAGLVIALLLGVAYLTRRRRSS